MLDWVVTLSLVFGGCCSNAITLEQVTCTHPRIGSLLTFLQFIVVALYGLPQHLTWESHGLRLRPRAVPLFLYLVQVILFSFVSLLNNAAFAYHIPMSVHIIFRSGGLIVSMVLGWTILGKKYTLTQAASVVLVTLGVLLTTLSASRPGANTAAHTDAHTYATGIVMLSLALLLSGFLGVVQDWTYSTYARRSSGTKPWQESMFYLHFLSLPLFVFVRDDISSQLRSIHSPSSPKFSLSKNVDIPTVYLPLLVNTVTQLVCVAGVNRLTTRVPALTVTLVLVVRKAVSLILSAVGGGVVVKYAARAMTRETPRTGNMDVDARMMWTGAALVMIGTIRYSFGSIKKQTRKGEKEK